MNSKNWFEVDRRGLAKILERRGKSFGVLELIQNAWDEPGVTCCDIIIESISMKLLRITVADDAPNGWRNLTDAFTLFAESKKKADPSLRGRFNLGEKLLIAICDEVEIISTAGGVKFDAEGRHALRRTRLHGTSVSCVMKASSIERNEIVEAIQTLVPPDHIKTTLHGYKIEPPKLIAECVEQLPTEIADGEGNLNRTVRQTRVEFRSAWVSLTDPKGKLYELGLPICELDAPVIVNVMQKVPLTLDRESVRPGYLRRINEIVLKHCSHLAEPEQLRSTWAEAAAEAADATPESIERVIAAKFGDKRVSFDPSDKEANALAVTHGYTVVHGGALSAGLWRNAKQANAILPAGQVTPSPKPYSPDGKPLKLCTDVTFEMQEVANYAKTVARLVLDCHLLCVTFAAEVTWPYAATYGRGSLTFNVGRLGKAWFDLRGNRRAIDDLIIHEFGHHFESNHLSEGYYDALTAIGAHMVELARNGLL